MAPDAQPQPRPPERLGPAAGLALLVHGLLLVALTVSVDWHSAEPESVSAELWAAVPQVAAPPPAPEPPPPAPAPEPKPEPRPATPPPAPPKVAPERDADIATERAERRKREEAERQKREAEQRAAEKKAAEEAERKKAREKAEAEKKAKADAEKKEKAEAERQQKADAERREREAAKKAEQQQAAQAKAEAQRLEKLRQDQLKRMQSSLGGTGSGSPNAAGTAARDAGPSASYGGKLRALIRENIVFADSVAGNPVAEVEVRAGPTGTIISRRLVKSSGVPAWDDAVLRAIDRIGTLPRDVDGRVPPTIVVTSRPKD